MREQLLKKMGDGRCAIGKPVVAPNDAFPRGPSQPPMGERRVQPETQGQTRRLRPLL
jgi:hypothetical protein